MYVVQIVRIERMQTLWLPYSFLATLRLTESMKGFLLELFCKRSSIHNFKTLLSESQHTAAGAVLGKPL